MSIALGAVGILCLAFLLLMLTAGPLSAQEGEPEDSDDTAVATPAPESDDADPATVTVETCTEDAETGEVTCVESTEPAGRTEIIEFPPPGEEDKSGAVPRACSFFAGQYICIEELEMTGLDSTLYVGAESSFTVTGEFLTPGAPPNENTYDLRVSISPASSGLYFERNPVNGSCSGTIKSVPVENAQGDGFHYSHDFTLYACDSPGGTVKSELVKNGSVLRSRSMTVEVPNRPPDIDGETDPEYRENDRIRVATYTISDEDGDRVRLSLLGPDSGVFFLDAINEYGILSFRNVPNYEEPADSNQDNAYNVTIRATDDGSPVRYTELDVVITVVATSTNSRRWRPGSAIERSRWKTDLTASTWWANSAIRTSATL